VTDGAGAGWHAKLRPHYNGVYFANGGFTRESGAALLAQGGADAIVYGTKFLANPDLPERFRRGALLNDPDRATYYSPGERGYTDYQTLG
jgi:N-ethylmaleimide reductase